MSDNFNVLTVSRQLRFYDCVLPLIKKHCSGNGYFAADTTEAKKLLLTADVDAVIINAPLSDGFAVDLAEECTHKRNLSVLMLVPKESFEAARQKLSESDVLLLPKPATAQTVTQALILLQSTAQKLKKITTVRTRSDTATELKLITRAKMILISSFGMSEEQAHKYIEKRAMEARKTRLHIAQSIINSYGS